MLKKAKQAKPAKPKAEKVKAEKGKSGQGQYFWTAFLEKRKKQKSMVRESALPKVPMSKDDRLKLIGAGALFLLVIIGFIVMNMIQSRKAEQAAAQSTNK